MPMQKRMNSKSHGISVQLRSSRGFHSRLELCKFGSERRKEKEIGRKYNGYENLEQNMNKILWPLGIQVITIDY